MTYCMLWSVECIDNVRLYLKTSYASTLPSLCTKKSDATSILCSIITDYLARYKFDVSFTDGGHSQDEYKLSQKSFTSKTRPQVSRHNKGLGEGAEILCRNNATVLLRGKTASASILLSVTGIDKAWRSRDASRLALP